MPTKKPDSLRLTLQRVTRITPLIVLLLGLTAASIELYFRLDSNTVMIWDTYKVSELNRHTRFPSMIYFKSPVTIAGQQVRGNLTLVYDYMLGYGRVPKLHVLTFDQFSIWSVKGELPNAPVLALDAERCPNSSDTSFLVNFEFESIVSGVLYFVTSPAPVTAQFNLFVRREVPSAFRQAWNDFRPYLGLYMVLLGIPGTLLAVMGGSREKSNQPGQ